MSDLFDYEHTAICGTCGKDVPTLEGWPIPIAGCVPCDTWTVYYQDKEPEIIGPDSPGRITLDEPYPYNQVNTLAGPRNFGQYRAIKERVQRERVER